MHKWTNPFFFNKSDNSIAILITCENISRAMVISNFYQKPCFTCLSGADPHGFHCFTEIGQIFHNRCIYAPGPPKSLRLRRSFRKSVNINPRSAPASRFCSCFIIRKLKQRRFWVMHVNWKWIIYPFTMPWWYQIRILYCLFSQGNVRFAGKKWSNTSPKIAKKATSGWSLWLKKHPMCLKTSYYNYY